MDATTVAVDLAKSVFELAVADGHWRIVERARLTRSQFERWFHNRVVERVVMEACGSAHFWARRLQAQGITVTLLPPRYVRAYVKRNKTDAADAAALLEALRCADVVPVRIKSVEQQALQSLHRVRSAWMATRTTRINTLRGCRREFGLCISAGSRVGTEQIARVLADPGSEIPMLLREPMKQLFEEIRLLEARIAQLERQLTAAAHESDPCTTLLTIPGVGLLTATAWWPPPAAASPTSRTHAISPPGSASRPRNTPRAATAVSAASPSAATGICACCLPTAPAR